MTSIDLTTHEDNVITVAKLITSKWFIDLKQREIIRELTKEECAQYQVGEVVGDTCVLGYGVSIFYSKKQNNTCLAPYLCGMKPMEEH